MSLHLALSGVFLGSEEGDAVWGQLPSPCRMLVCLCAGDVRLDPMVMEEPARSLHWKVMNFPFGDCANTLFPLKLLPVPCSAPLWVFPAVVVTLMLTPQLSGSLAASPYSD